MSGTVNELLAVARGQLGVKETGGGTRGNRQRYSTEMGMPITEWCAIYVSWCLRKAQVPLAYRSTRVTLFARHYAAIGRYVSKPQPGDLVCFDWGMNGAYDHIGIVEKVLSGGRIQTIEGNTNPGNGQDGVYRMVRSTSSVRGYCRPHYRATATPKPPAPAPKPTVGTYVVRKGDTLAKIGDALNIPWKTLAALNRIKAPYTIRPGQKLSTGKATPAPTTKRYHTVARGNTLGGIAAKYKTTLAKLRQLNPQIKNVNLIKPGDKVRYR